MIIIGAGLSGLLAGALDRRATVLEAQKELPNNHQAVLRFRSDKIALALNIPFRPVRVMKDVVVNGTSVPLTPKWANAYARKVIGRHVSRSIGSLEPAQRWIAPSNFITQLAEMVSDRLHLGHEVNGFAFGQLPRPLISTIPLPKLLDMLGYPEPRPEFRYSAIRVAKYYVHGADLFQTVYFPDPYQGAYRASITGDELMVEAMDDNVEVDLDEVLSVFDLRQDEVESLGATRQKLGKIQELDPETRKALLGEITRKHRVWSLGRFAIWKNILLDDVLDDYWSIRAMMRLNPYDALKAQV